MPFLGQMHGNPEFGSCPGGLDSLPPHSPHVPHLTLRQLWPDVNFLLPHLSSVGDVPQSLPSFLVAHCGNPASWIYSDQKCDGTNNCGDCSDELSPGGGLGTGWAGAGGQAAVSEERLTRESLRFPLHLLLAF